MDESVMSGNSYSSSPRATGKDWQRRKNILLVGHNEERPIIPQPQCGRCHWAGTRQATPVVIAQAELRTELVQAEQWRWWCHKVFQL